MKKPETIHQNILPIKKYNDDFLEKNAGNFGFDKSFHSFATTYDDSRDKYKGPYTSES